MLPEERALLRPIRKMANEIVDTTSLTVHDLRQVFMGLIRGDRRAAPLVVTVLSAQTTDRRGNAVRPTLFAAYPDPAAMAAAAWRTWSMNEQPPTPVPST